MAGEKKNQNGRSGKIKVISSGDILISYLEQPKMDLDIARQYWLEVAFEYNRQQTVIGFKNRSKGCEPRNSTCKGSFSPKELGRIERTNSNSVAVLKDFSGSILNRLKQSGHLKALTLPDLQRAFLMLNSLAFFEKSHNTMEKYDAINLYPDQDKAGIAATIKALLWSHKFKDGSGLYQGFEDLNDYLIKCPCISITKNVGQKRQL